MSNMRQVAERAGVSPTTVSHVINNTRHVSEDTRLRVMEAMVELGYQPNILARSLRRGETHTIGLILPDSANPFFAEIGRKIEEAAYQKNYSVILCNTEGETEKERWYVDVLGKKQVDGIIFVGTGDQADSLQILFNRDIPVVLVDRDLPNLEVDAVLTDNLQGGFLATTHLIELGHQRIGCIMGPSNLTPSAQRVTGYRNALHAAGLVVDESLIRRGDFHPRAGHAAALSLFDHPDSPTALFVCNDMMAIGVLAAAAEVECRVPEDLAVVGFDDIELASYTIPPLTTIAQPKREIGRRAVQLLVERIADKSRQVQRVLLPTALIVRQSTGGSS